MVFRECGCRTYMTDHPNLFVPMVEYCPMHEVAPELLEALKEILSSWEQMQSTDNLDDIARDMFNVSNAIIKAKQAIAKAESE